VPARCGGSATAAVENSSKAQANKSELETAHRADRGARWITNPFGRRPFDAKGDGPRIYVSVFEFLVYVTITPLPPLAPPPAWRQPLRRGWRP